MERNPWLHLRVRGSLDAEVRIADPDLFAKEDSAPVGPLSRFTGNSPRDGWLNADVPLAGVPLRTREAAVLVLSFSAGSSGTLQVSDIVFSFDPAAPSAGEGEISRAMWFWDFGDCLDDASMCSRTFDFARTRGIGTIYGQIRYKCDDGSNCALEQPARLRAILRDAAARGLRIQALDGAPEYALTRFHARVKGTVDAVLRFNAGGAPDQRFTGIHLDIEPYLLLGFSGNARDRILREYLVLNREVARQIAGAGKDRIEIGADIPFWYDEASVNGRNPYVVSFDGKTQDVSRHLIDMLDSVTLMDYRNSAPGNDGIIAHAAGEMSYGTKAGKRVRIGVETLPQKPSPAVFLAGLSEKQWTGMRGQPLLYERALNGYRIKSFAGGGERYIGLETRGAPDQNFLDSLKVLASGLGLSPVTEGERSRRLSKARSAVSANEYTAFNAVDLPGFAAFSVNSVPLAKITFDGKTQREMDRTLRSVEEYFSAAPAFGGIAIHAYSSYSAMPE